VNGVIQDRIAAAGFVIQPEREIGQRTRLPQRERPHPPRRRRQVRIGEDGIIVKVKARSERSAERDQRGGQQKESRTHDTLRAYVKRPKTAAERKERVAEILRRLDRTYSQATCALLHPSP